MDAKSVRGAEGPGRERELTLTKILNAPPSLVFRTWTESKHLAQWWGPAGFTNPICEIDLRVGGEWSIVMRSPDGKEQTVKGMYREIIPPQKLVFTNLAVSPEGDLILEASHPCYSRILMVIRN